MRKKQFQESRSLNTLLQYLSAVTWENIGFCRSRPQLRYSETTITEEIVRQFELINFDHNVRMLVMTATHEKANGNEIEIIINTSTYKIRLPIQAKILYPSMKYEKISHISGGRYQIDLLLDYARAVNGLPLYFLYNFSQRQEENDRIEKDWKVPIEHFGVSFTSAYHIYSRFYPWPETGRTAWRIPTFYDLVGGNVAFPFDQITRFSERDFLPAFLKKTSVYFNFIDESITRYYQPPPGPGRISGIEIDGLERGVEIQVRDESVKFIPKYVINIYFDKSLRKSQFKRNIG